GENREVIPALGALRQGVGGDDLTGAALAEALAGRAGEHAVGRRDDHVARTGVLQHLHSTCDGATGVDHVVQQHAGAALDVADHAVGGDLVGYVDVAGLVDEGQRSAAQLVGPLLGLLHATGVRGDDHDVVQVVVLLDVLGQDRQRVHVIDRAIEEALNLVGVQIHGDQAVRASSLKQVSDQTGGDWLAAAVL